jgi:hypothetical protein
VRNAGFEKATQLRNKKMRAQCFHKAGVKVFRRIDGVASDSVLPVTASGEWRGFASESNAGESPH